MVGPVYALRLALSFTNQQEGCPREKGSLDRTVDDNGLASIGTSKAMRILLGLNSGERKDIEAR